MPRWTTGAIEGVVLKRVCNIGGGMSAYELPMSATITREPVGRRILGAPRHMAALPRRQLRVSSFLLLSRLSTLVFKTMFQCSHAS